MEENEKFRILIVDDENANLDVLSDILKKDYTITVAKSGEAAIKRAEEDAPDLILLDVLIPDMNGFDVLLALKESDRSRDIPIIFITVLTSPEDEEKGLLLGAVDYIIKPFNNSIVRARVGTQIKIVKQIRTIERLGMIDALTDIPNRRFFDVRLNEEWRRTCRQKAYLSMLTIDVDKFKAYNDTYGHPQGDILLQFVAKILTSNLRRSSDLAARLGGDEFAVLLADTDPEGAFTVADNIRKAMEAGVIPRSSTGESTSVTVSIGVNTVIPTMDMQINDFIEQSDKKLYTAKTTGKNKVVRNEG
jgi:diguanylate cyclase (GGDEF)-like protein